MKKILTIISLILIVAMAASLFVACNTTNDETEPTTTEPEDNKVTVTWYYGSKVLKTEEVEKGTKLTTWTPELEGKEFTGWFNEASATVAFDFETVINEETDIFAAFKSNEYVEDTNAYYLIGTGSGDMKASGWNHDNSIANLMMTKKESTTENVYTIDIVMYAGDAFQICYGGTYDGQVGIGYVPGVAYADGVNRYDGNTYTSADKKYAEVKNADGEVVFTGHDEFNKEYYTWNIFLNEGHDGKYRIIYTTNPASPAYNTITFELLEKLEPQAVTHDMYVVGTMNDFTDNADYQMKADDLKENFSFTLTITEDMYADWTAEDPANPFGEKCAAIKVHNGISDAWSGIAESTVEGPWVLGTGESNLFLKAGQYVIDYNVAENKATVKVAEKGYYLAGVLDGEGFWNCKSAYKFEKLSDTEYVVYYTFTEADTDKSWMGESLGAIKATYGFGGCDADLWFGQEADGENLMIDAYGLYEIKLTLTGTDENGNATGYITATKLEGYFLVGTIGDGDTWRPESSNAITGDTIAVEYTWTQKDNADWLGGNQIAAVKIVNVTADGTIEWFGAAGGDNVMITEVGTYNIALADGAVTATKK